MFQMPIRMTQAAGSGAQIRANIVPLLLGPEHCEVVPLEGGAAAVTAAFGADAPTGAATVRCDTRHEFWRLKQAASPTVSPAVSPAASPAAVRAHDARLAAMIDYAGRVEGLDLGLD
jgi:hypothetical protein